VAEEEAAEEMAEPSASLPAEQPFFPSGTSFVLVLVSDEDSEPDHNLSSPPMALEAIAIVAHRLNCLAVFEVIVHVLVVVARNPAFHMSTMLCNPHNAKHFCGFSCRRDNTMGKSPSRCRWSEETDDRKNDGFSKPVSSTTARWQ